MRYVTLSATPRVGEKTSKRQYEIFRKSPKALETAIRIARALLDADPGNARLAVNLARIYRGCDKPAAGAEVLECFTGEVGNDRGFWYEWGTCAGNAGDHAVNAVLGGWSLADQAAAGPPDNRQAKLSLAGLGVAFGELHQRFRDARFNAGCGAVAYLGLRLDLDAKARGYFERHRREAEAAGAEADDPAEALERLRAALIAAWEVCGRQSDLAARISPPASMSFSGLSRLFGSRIASWLGRKGILSSGNEGCGEALGFLTLDCTGPNNRQRKSPDAASAFRQLHPHRRLP